jgi:hypothetical protein
MENTLSAVSNGGCVSNSWQYFARICSLNEDKEMAFFIVPLYVEVRYNEICDLWDFTELDVTLNWQDYSG